VLHEYVSQGGGLFFTAIPSGWNNVMPTINQFLQPWGARCLDEQVVDPETVLQSDAWFQRYPFCWTDNVVAHPITRGVKGTWYPACAWRADGILTTVAFTTDNAIRPGRCCCVGASRLARCGPRVANWSPTRQ
jgi:hypothetical protein